MPDPHSERDRLEAFSDGVMAIIVTLMILELKPPREARPEALLALWPGFLIYVVSFTFVAIYWVNHRYIFKHLKAVTEPILWSNILLLLAISLIPFSTAYMGESRLAPFPMALYCGVLMVCGLGFAMLRGAVAGQITAPAEREAFNGRRVKLIGAGTFAILVAASATAFVQPVVSFGLILASSLLHLGPFTRRGVIHPPSTAPTEG